MLGSVLSLRPLPGSRQSLDCCTSTNEESSHGFVAASASDRTAQDDIFVAWGRRARWVSEQEVLTGYQAQLSLVSCFNFDPYNGAQG